MDVGWTCNWVQRVISLILAREDIEPEPIRMKKETMSYSEVVDGVVNSGVAAAGRVRLERVIMIGHKSLRIK